MERLVVESEDLMKLVESVKPHHRPVSITRESPPDHASRALAEIVAAEAAKDPYVVAVREIFTYYDNGTDGKSWAELNEEAAVAAYGRSGVDTLAFPRARPTSEQSRTALEAHIRRWRGEMSTEEEEAFVKSLGRSGISDADAFVDCLECLVDVLVDRYGWNPLEAQDFIIKGITPRMPIARVRYQENRPIPATNRIILEVNPRLSPRDVMDLYAKVRREIIGEDARYRPIDEKGAHLAVFADRCNDGRTWEEALKAWNTEHPDQTYAETRSFTRDCRESYQRVTGQPLSWKNGGRSKS
ncbi:MAG: hypothetical protein ACM3RP_10735 [Chitinophagales bacterium]